jgi:hypothetical protein
LTKAVDDALVGLEAWAPRQWARPMWPAGNLVNGRTSCSKVRKNALRSHNNWDLRCGKMYFRGDTLMVGQSEVYHTPCMHPDSPFRPLPPNATVQESNFPFERKCHMGLGDPVW